MAKDNSNDKRPESGLDRLEVPPEVWEAFFLGNLIARTDMESVLAYRICWALEKDVDGLGAFANRFTFPVYRETADDGTKYDRCTFAKGEKNRADSEDWEFLQEQFPERVAGVDFSKFYIDNQHRNLMTLADALGLSNCHRQLLTYLYLQQIAQIPGYFSVIAKTLPPSLLPDFLARLFDDEANIQEYKKALEQESILIFYGFVDYQDGVFAVSKRLLDILGTDILAPEHVVERVIGKPVQTELSIKDFGHFSDTVDLIVATLRLARAQRQAGINILLYGPAGSGKTELAKAVAAAAGLSLYSIAEDDGRHKPHLDPSKESPAEGNAVLRSDHMLRAQALLANNPSTVLLFDEIEDLLQSDGRPASKIILNRLVEANPVPTIWCGNNPELFHPSLRQRFALSLNVGFQPTQIRANIWRRQAVLKGVDLAEGKILHLARKYNIPPRIVALAVDALRRHGKMEIMDTVIAEAARITYGQAEAICTPFQLPAAFDPAWLNFDDKDSIIAEAIKLAQQRTRLSMLVTGQAGSGETELLYYLAEKGNLHPQEVMATDLVKGEGSPAENLKTAMTAAVEERLFLSIRQAEELAPLEPKGFGLARQWDNPVWHAFGDSLLHHNAPIMVVDSKDSGFPRSFSSLFAREIRMKPLQPVAVQAMFRAIFGHAEDSNFNLGSQGFIFADFSRAARVLAEDQTRNPEACWAAVKKEAAVRVLSGDAFGFAAHAAAARGARA